MKKYIWITYTAFMTALAMAVAQYFIWLYAPVEETMGLVQKIFYPHVALAWWGLFSFIVVGISGTAFLWTKKLFWDHLGGAVAEVGVLFSGLTLILGMLWGRSAWGVWWTWDPRLTTTLIMWFVYCAYLMLRAGDIGGENRPKVTAVFGIIAVLDVPLVFLSARMWRSIHPAILKSKGSGLEPEMLTTLLVCLGAFGLLWLILTTLRHKQLTQAEALDTLLKNAE